jgi:TusA-related sulfurtransferase
MSDIVHELDARGLDCPMPLLKAKQALSRLQQGEQLKVLATDAGSVRDFKTFADLSGHKLLQSEQQGDEYIYVLEKR